jgi:hypothetical protein
VTPLSGLDSSNNFSQFSDESSDSNESISEDDPSGFNQSVSAKPSTTSKAYEVGNQYSSLSESEDSFVVPSSTKAIK